MPEKPRKRRVFFHIRAIKHDIMIKINLDYGNGLTGHRRMVVIDFSINCR